MLRILTVSVLFFVVVVAEISIVKKDKREESTTEAKRELSRLKRDRVGIEDVNEVLGHAGSGSSETRYDRNIFHKNQFASPNKALSEMNYAFASPSQAKLSKCKTKKKYSRKEIILLNRSQTKSSNSRKEVLSHKSSTYTFMDETIDCKTKKKKFSRKEISSHLSGSFEPIQDQDNSSNSRKEILSHMSSTYAPTQDQHMTSKCQIKKKKYSRKEILSHISGGFALTQSQAETSIFEGTSTSHVAAESTVSTSSFLNSRKIISHMSRKFEPGQDRDRTSEETPTSHVAVESTLSTPSFSSYSHAASELESSSVLENFTVLSTSEVTSRVFNAIEFKLMTGTSPEITSNIPKHILTQSNDTSTFVLLQAQTSEETPTSHVAAESSSSTPSITSYYHEAAEIEFSSGLAENITELATSGLTGEIFNVTEFKSLSRETPGTHIISTAGFSTDLEKTPISQAAAQSNMPTVKLINYTRVSLKFQVFPVSAKYSKSALGFSSLFTSNNMQSFASSSDFLLSPSTSKISSSKRSTIVNSVGLNSTFSTESIKSLDNHYTIHESKEPSLQLVSESRKSKRSTFPMFQDSYDKISNEVPSMNLNYYSSNADREMYVAAIDDLSLFVDGREIPMMEFTEPREIVHVRIPREASLISVHAVKYGKHPGAFLVSSNDGSFNTDGRWKCISRHVPLGKWTTKNFDDSSWFPPKLVHRASRSIKKNAEGSDVGLILPHFRLLSNGSWWIWASDGYENSGQIQFSEAYCRLHLNSHPEAKKVQSTASDDKEKSCQCLQSSIRSFKSLKNI